MNAFLISETFKVDEVTSISQRSGWRSENNAQKLVMMWNKRLSKKRFAHAQCIRSKYFTYVNHQILSDLMAFFRHSQRHLKCKRRCANVHRRRRPIIITTTTHTCLRVGPINVEHSHPKVGFENNGSWHQSHTTWEMNKEGHKYHTCSDAGSSVHWFIRLMQLLSHEIEQ